MELDRIVLYHGSEKVADKPEFHYHKNRPDIEEGALDYGDGLYCTRDMEAAKEWACSRGNPGKINKYSIDCRSLHNIVDLYTKTDEDSVLTWISILLHFRLADLTPTFKEDNKNAMDFLEQEYFSKISEQINTADIIIGYRADDSYFNFPKAFVRGDISIDTLRESFVKRTLGIQIAIMSQRAFDLLKFISAADVDITYYDQYRRRIDEANAEYHAKSEADRKNPDKRTIFVIMKEKGWQTNDQKL